VTTPLTRSELVLVGGSRATKNIAKKTRKRSYRRATEITFSEFGGWRRKKKKAPRGLLKPRFAQF